MKCKYIYGSEFDFERRLDAWLLANPDICITRIDSLSSPSNMVSVLFSYKIVSNTKTSKPVLNGVIKKTTALDTIPRCPACGGEMQVVANHTKGELFFGCKKFPTCKGSRKFEQKHWEIFGGDPGKAGRSEFPF